MTSEVKVEQGAERSLLFLAAFNRVERVLRELAGDSAPFRQLVSSTRRRSAVVRRFHDDLVEMSELRNAIVHDSVEPAAVIAEPSEAAVSLMVRIADLLEAPPAIMRRTGEPVITVHEGDELLHALRLMVKHDITKLPVLDSRGRIVALLTERRIARWFAITLVAGKEANPASLVSEVTAVAGAQLGRNYALLPKDASVYDAEERFAASHDLEAILITESGEPHQRPLGIFTQGDMARWASVEQRQADAD